MGGERPESPVPVGRLAPSPTGLLHLGHARSFLLAWWNARARGGRVLLRLEDLDGPRVRPEFAEACLRDLEWLGLDWDGPVLRQADDLEPYRMAVATLLERGLAYACICSRRDVREAQSAPHESVPEPGAGSGELRYPGTCRGRFASVEQAAATGLDVGLRLRVAPGPVRVEDGFAPPAEFDVAAEAGDFPIARRDGLPAYQLAVVVDDARQGVTEVLRGDDLLPSTARQILVQEALGLPRPAWFHVPLVEDCDGRRLAKRSDDLGLAALREQGVDPRAVVAWAARSAGQEVDGPAEAREVLAAFDLARLPHAPVRLRSSYPAFTPGA